MTKPVPNANPPIFTPSFIEVTLINFLVFFSFQMIFPTLPLYVKDLGGSDAIIGLVAGAFTVTSLLTRPFAGQALDKIGRKQVFVIGLLVLVVTCISYSFAVTIEMIIVIRLLHGLGWGITGTSASTVVAEIIPQKRFGEAMGYFSMANSVSLAIAPAAGLYLVHTRGFHDMFLLSALVVGIAAIMAFWVKYPSYQPQPAVPGQHESLYEKSAFGAALMIFFVTATFGAVSSFLPLYAYSRGFEHVGWFFTVYAIAIFFSRPLTGRIVDHYSYDVTIIPGMLAIITAMTMIAYAPNREWFYVAAFIYGLGFGTCQMSLQTMVVRHIPRPRLGAANATYFSGLDLGMGLGALTLGSVAELMGYSQMFYVAAGAMVVALLIYVFYLRRFNPAVTQPPVAA